MIKVKTEEALNRELKEDVYSSSGQLILPSGVQLSQALINALLKQNVKTVYVSDPESAFPEKSDINSELNLWIEKLFIRHRGQFMKEFKECLISYQKTERNG